MRTMSIPTNAPSTPQQRSVTCLPRRDDAPDSHGTESLVALSRRIADLLGLAYAGIHDASARNAYLVPADTLVAPEAAALGVRGRDDVFGGVVPHAFVATKLISHPAVGPDARVPEGWSSTLLAGLGDALLPGFAVFDADAAHAACEKLHGAGPLRLKLARGIGGHGQFVIDDAASLTDALAQLPEGELEHHGATLEQNIDEECTFSVGTVLLGGRRISYVGTQHTTGSRDGGEAYGGSRLRCVRGGFDALLERTPDATERRAVMHARRFDRAVHEAFPGFFASRCNYDVIAGRDANGRERLGVLEQSWRLGGATPAELAAFEAFANDDTLDAVHTECVEVHALVDPPPDATVHYRAVAPEVGPLTKYSRCVRDEDLA